MTTNEIKKLLYKRNPLANLQYIRKGKAYYMAGFQIDENDNTLPIKMQYVYFEVPVADLAEMGDADFYPAMLAKLLIRWLLKTEEQPT